jgi:predicted transcriptional regulator
MIDAHIHRVVVVDADERPIGVVASTDVLAAVT